MKKRMAAVLCAMLLLSGCSAQEIRDEVQEEAQDIKEDIQEAVPSATADRTQGETDTSQFIGEERAKEIALERAGITAEGVTFDRVELENDDGVWQYELEFRKDRTEYNADIAAADGNIISWEIETE